MQPVSKRPVSHSPGGEHDPAVWPSLWTAVMVQLASLLGGYTVGRAVIALCSGPSRPPDDALVAGLVAANTAYTVMVGAMSLWLALKAAGGSRDRRWVQLVRVSKPEALTAFLAVGLAGVATLLLSTIPLPALTESVSETMVKAASSPMSLAVAVLIVPISEELWYRGLVYGSLEGYGPVVAATVSLVVCVSMHWPPVHMLGSLPGAVAITWLRYRTGKLGPCILGHLTWNALVLGLSLAAEFIQA